MKADGLGACDLMAVSIAIGVWLLIWKLRFAPTLEAIRRRERERPVRARDHRPRWKAGLQRASASFSEFAPDRHSGAFLLMPLFVLVFLLARLVCCDWAG